MSATQLTHDPILPPKGGGGVTPPRGGGGRHLGPESIGSTRRRRPQRKLLQGAEGAEADLHCDTMVQICGAVPPTRGGTVTL